jgi:hypothetical protein
MNTHPGDDLAVDRHPSRIPEGLNRPALNEGQVVALLIQEEARGNGWPATVVLDLARSWAEAGIRVLLADADLTSSTLSAQLESVPAEGLVDVVVYGASPGRVSEKVDSENLAFLSPGTVAGAPEGVFGHPRLTSFFNAVRQSRTTLILYLPEDLEGSRLAADAADRVFRLAEPEVVSTTETADTTAADEPAVGGPASEPAFPEQGSSATAGSVAGPSAARPGRGGSDAGPEAERVKPGERRVEAQPRQASNAGKPKTERKKAGIPAWLPLAVLLLVAALLIAAAWFGVIEVPGLTPGAEASALLFPPPQPGSPITPG